MFVSTTCNSQDQPGLAWCTKGAEIARKNKEELIKVERRCPLPAPFCSGFLCDPCASARNVFSSLCEKRLLSLSRSEERRVGKKCRSRWAPDHYNTH